MKITQEKTILEMVGVMIEKNRKRGAGTAYIQFLTAVYREAHDDKNFGEALEACLCLNFDHAPTIEQVEVSLAKMEGGIRPLLVDRGIVEPRPMPPTLNPSAEDGKETYRLTELPAIHIDSWVEGISNMTGIDKVYKEAHEMAGLEINEDDPICPAEMESEYTALAEKYDFRFNRKGQIVSYNLNKGE